MKNMPRPEIDRPCWKCAAKATSVTETDLPGTPTIWMLPVAIRLQVAGIGLEHIGGNLQHHGACFLGGGDHGVAGAMRSTRGKRSHAMRSGIGVRGVDDHTLGGHAERLGADLRHDRFYSLSQIDAGKRHYEIAGRGGVNQGLCRVAAEIHASRVIDGRDAAATLLGHRLPFPLAR